MTTFRRWLKKIVHNPWLDFTIGSILLISGLWDAWQTVAEDLANGNLRTSHGVILFGLITALRALAEVFGGLEFMDEAEYVEQVREHRV